MADFLLGERSDATIGWSNVYVWFRKAKTHTRNYLILEKPKKWIKTSIEIDSFWYRNRSTCSEHLPDCFPVQLI